MKILIGVFSLDHLFILSSPCFIEYSHSLKIYQIKIKYKIKNT